MLATREFTVVFRFRASDYHLARRKNEGGCLWLADTHYDRCKALKGMLAEDRDFTAVPDLWIVFRIAGMQGDGFGVETAAKVDCGDNISSKGC